MEWLVAEIVDQPNQKITFKRFMEQALYHPQWGYYASGQVQFGKRGDFFTSVQVGTVFAEVLARYILSCWKKAGSPREWSIIEFGAGTGSLLYQLNHLLAEQNIHMPQLIIVEVSAALQQRQQQCFQAAAAKVIWVTELSQVAQLASFHFLLSNEVVDAFPVHRVLKQVAGWSEIYISLDHAAGQLCELLGELSTPAIAEYLEQYFPSAAVGQSVEVNLAARKWLAGIVDWVQQSAVKAVILTIDYGSLANELVHKKSGTLRTFYQHQQLANPYHKIGQADITADVNFNALIDTGIALGLQYTKYESQAKFLQAAGIFEVCPFSSQADPFTGQAKRQRAVMQLIHPETMGERFQVLTQANFMLDEDGI